MVSFGVFYHRYDAIDALARAARVAKHLLIVETHLDLEEVDRPAMAFYPPGLKPCDDDTSWWGPNSSCMRELLLGHKFAEIEFVKNGNRGVFHAWRTTELRRTALPVQVTSTSVEVPWGRRIIGAVRRRLRAG